MRHLGKLLPIDGYNVKLMVSLPTAYHASLMHLYQPLIGIEAVSLYQLLIQESNIQAETNAQTHHSLLNYLNIPLNKLYEARLKLEGIGLLKTYKDETEDRNNYTYVVQAPFTPMAFFNDMMLSELLYRQIGHTKFYLLKNYYTENKVETKGKEVTSSFDHIFDTVQPQNVEPLHTYKVEPTSIPIEQKVDFSLIEQQLQRKSIPHTHVLTEKNKTIINQLATLYDLASHELEKAIEWALTEENKLSITKLKAVCHDIFQMEHNVSDTKLTVKQEEQTSEQPQKQPTKMEKLLHTFETLSPKELLEDLSSGNNAPEHDVAFIRDLMVQQGLPAPVMNVLIHYVMLQSDMKLPRKYMATIASNWSRKKFTTAKQAMDYVHEQINNQRKPKKQYHNRTTQRSNEIIPDWFKKQTDKEVPKEQAKTLTKEEQKEQEELEKLLQKYATD